MAEYDILIKNATIVDGSGEPGYTGDLAVKGDRIAAIGDVSGTAERIIDGSSLIASPGFIDPHSHADIAILGHPTADNLAMQGITTFIGGNCGVSAAPTPDWETFEMWLARVEEVGSALNYIPLVGHHAIRMAVMGDDVMRSTSQDEIEKMKVYVDQAMQEGAWGLSTFRDPGPSEFATVEELVDLMYVVKEYEGFYMPHTYRIQSQWPTEDAKELGYIVFHGSYEDIHVGRYRGYLEAIDIGRRTGSRVHVAHLGTAFLINQPHPSYLDEATARATLEIFDTARAEGVDITFDVIAASSSIAGLLPLLGSFTKWVDPNLEPEVLKERLNSDEFRTEVYRTYEAGRLKFAMVHTRVDPYWFDCFLIVNCSNPDYAGRTVEQIANETGKEPLDTVLDIVAEDPNTTWVQFRDKRMNDEAIAVFLNHPLGMPCTDTIFVTSLEKAEKAHQMGGYGMSPIMFGLYPHYLGHFVRERGDFSLEWAVKQATSVVADRFGIQERGRLQAGNYADIVLFDIDSLGMCGDFDKPAQRPEGMSCVMVNGQVIYEDGEVTGALPGVVLRRG